jgi:hypothetical protein
VTELSDGSVVGVNTNNGEEAMLTWLVPEDEPGMIHD